MLSNKSNKELVEAGHQFAKALDADMPLTDIAKLVSALATRLDCAIVRGDELQQKLDAMEDKLRIKENHIRLRDSYIEELEAREPVVDADYLNTVRAEAICSAIAECTDHYDTDYVMDAYDFSYEIAEMRSAGAIDLRDELVAYANQLRSGPHDTADKAG